VIAPRAYELASKLWWPSLLRGIAAVALGMWVLALPPATAAELTHAIAAYWVIDAVLILVAGLSAATLALRRFFLILRAAAGIITALVILGLPLSSVFGAYEPGQFMLLVVVLPLVVCAIVLQVLAAIFDLLMCLEVRRHLPGEWSLALSAVLSLLFGLGLLTILLVPPPVLGRGLGSIAVLGGVGVIAGALRLRPTRDPSLPVFHR
jgi:uncharacterized membrane protein HdeD (DUF308 family)